MSNLLRIVEQLLLSYLYLVGETHVKLLLQKLLPCGIAQACNPRT